MKILLICSSTACMALSIFMFSTGNPQCIVQGFLSGACFAAFIVELLKK